MCIRDRDGPRGTREQLQCVVDALDERTGTREKGALDRHADDEGTRTHCSILLGELRGSEARKRALEKTRYVSYDTPLWPLWMALHGDDLRDAAYAYNFSVATRGIGAVDVFTSPKQVVFQIPQAVGVEAFRESATHTTRAALASMASFGMRRAALRSFLGDEAGAMTALDELDAKLTPFSRRSYTDDQQHEWDNRTWRIANDDYEKYQRLLEAEETRQRKTYDPDKDAAERVAEGFVKASRAMRAAVLLRAGKATEAKALTADTKALRTDSVNQDALFRLFVDARSSHDPRAQESLARGDGRESNRKLWLAAQTGDGKALVALSLIHISEPTRPY